MPLMIAAGQYYNLLERALSVTLSPAIDALYPVAGCFDGRPSRSVRHGSNAANPSITFDLAPFAPAGPGTQDIVVRTGERRFVTGVGTTTISIRNLLTGKYLTSGGAWQAGSTNCLTAAGTLAYQVESFTACQSPTAILRIVMSGGTTVADWPRWNAVMIFGHNLDPGLTVEMRSSTDNFSSVNALEVTGAITQPSFYMLKASPITSRYGRVLFTGTNQAIPWYAEVAPMYLETPTLQTSADGYELAFEEAQVRNDGPWGTSYVYNMAPWPRRTIALHFRMGTVSEAEIRQEIVLRCRGGAYPLVVVPNSAEPAILLTRLTQKWTEQRKLTTYWSSDLIAAEEAILTPLS